MGRRKSEQYQKMLSWLKVMMGANLVLVILLIILGAAAFLLNRQVSRLSAELESRQTSEEQGQKSNGENTLPERSEASDPSAEKTDPAENTDEQPSSEHRPESDSDDEPAIRNFVVCLDAGHGGKHGATSTIDGRFESDDTLRLTLAVQRALEQYPDVTVVMTRTEDVDVELEDRAGIANEAGADLFVSFHRNSNTAGDKGGVEGWIKSTNPEDSRAAGEMILSAMEKVGVTTNFGVKSGTWDDPNANYKIIRLANMPAVLLEVGYLNYARDNELYDQNLEAYAQASAGAIYEWLGEWAER